MKHIAIQAEGLGKEYRIGSKVIRYKTMRDAITNAFLTPFRKAKRIISGEATGAAGLSEKIWALKDISFEVKHGEVVGIIGRNGAGKSTLLKILTRITEPTEGFARIHGRVGSLLEVGTGFHPELTGRENIFLNGAILGMNKQEIDSKFDEIVEFAELDKFIDTPVKHYSSGMYVRLAFAVAAHLEPEILLVDEVLAVGDAAFQQKCLGKMGNVAKEGRTVLFVSHNMGTISSLCPRCIYLENGKIKIAGNTDEVIQQYLGDLQAMNRIPLAERTDREGNGKVRVTGIKFMGTKTGLPLEAAVSGQDVFFEVEYTTDGANHSVFSRFTIDLAVSNSLGQFITVFNSKMANGQFEAPSRGKIYCHVPKLPFTGGVYTIRLSIWINSALADQIENALTINVETGDYFGSGFSNVGKRQGVYVPHYWSTEMIENQNSSKFHHFFYKQLGEVE